MRKVRYAVAVSLDGYIAGPKGEADWITMDPEIDFAGLFEQFDTFLLGRRTFEAMGRAGQGGSPGVKTLVFSRTLRQEDYPGVTIVADGAEETVAALRAESGKGYLAAACYFAVCSMQAWSIRSRLPSCRSFWAGGFRCCLPRPSK
jgi:dihydrofolate reductase